MGLFLEGGPQGLETALVALVLGGAIRLRGWGCNVGGAPMDTGSFVDCCWNGPGGDCDMGIHRRCRCIYSRLELKDMRCVA